MNALAMVVQPAVAAAEYSIVEIEHTWRHIRVQDINNHGAVTGSISSEVGVSQAFVWTPNGGVVTLGTLSNHPYSRGLAINDADDVVGYSSDSQNGEMRAFLWREGVGMEALVPEGDYLSAAHDINVHGQVVGWWQDSGSGESTAFVYDQMHGMRPIEVPGIGARYSFVLNNHGQMVLNDRFVYTPGEAPVDMLPDGYLGIAATAMNDEGVVTGWVETNVGTLHPFMWHVNTGLVELTSDEMAGGGAHAINNVGQIVGHGVGNGGESIAFLYENGTMYNLLDLLDDADSGWSSFTPIGINDHGQILGDGIFDGEFRAVILNPIPEPASLLIVALGGVLMTCRRSRA